MIKEIQNRVQEILNSAIGKPNTQALRAEVSHKLYRLLLEYDLQDLQYNLQHNGETLVIVPVRKIDELAFYSLLNREL